MSIEVCNESGVPVDESLLASVARFSLDALHVNPAAELSILVVTEEVMSELHERWMDEPGPTDVLSFPMDELRPGTEDQPTPPGLLGSARRAHIADIDATLERLSAVQAEGMDAGLDFHRSAARVTRQS